MSIFSDAAEILKKSEKIGKKEDANPAYFNRRTSEISEELTVQTRLAVMVTWNWMDEGQTKVRYVLSAPGEYPVHIDLKIPTAGKSRASSKSKDK